MKKLVFSLMMMIMSSLVIAQSNAVPATQTVLNILARHPNALVVSGKLYNAANGKIISDAKLNLSKLNAGVLAAAVDKDGNYAVALNKDLVNQNTTLTFMIDGYKDIKLKKVKMNKDHYVQDVRISPEEKKDPTVIRYVLSDDPFNTLVIKF